MREDSGDLPPQTQLMRSMWANLQPNCRDPILQLHNTEILSSFSKWKLENPNIIGKTLREVKCVNKTFSNGLTALKCF